MAGDHRFAVRIGFSGLGAVMTCPIDTPCIEWQVDALTGSPMAVPVISTIAGSNIDCGPDGLTSPPTLQVTTCNTFPAVVLDRISPGQTVLAEAFSVILINPTDDRVMHTIVTVQFGSTSFRLDAATSANVADFIQLGVALTLPPSFSFTDRCGTTSLNDANFEFPFNQTRMAIPGRHQTRIVCPDLPPGKDVEVKYQREVTASGATGNLVNVLLQPTTIRMWGIIV